MKNVPIVIVAFNRPDSLKRLLFSLKKAEYPQNVDLIISIDQGDNEDVIKIAEEFVWDYGEKKIITHEIREILINSEFFLIFHEIMISWCSSINEICG